MGALSAGRAGGMYGMVSHSPSMPLYMSLWDNGTSYLVPRAQRERGKLPILLRLRNPRTSPLSHFVAKMQSQDYSRFKAGKIVSTS